MNKLFLLGLLVAVSVGSEYALQAQWKDLDNVFGRTGTIKNDVYKVTFPRTDLKVKIDDIPLEPGLALTAWIAFRTMNTSTMMMGDLVLLESEINPVEQELVANHISITALHNHIIGEKPKVMYLHFEGKGEPRKLAEAIKTVLAQTGTLMTPQKIQPTGNEEADWSHVESILGFAGQHKGNLLQFGFPRSEIITEQGMDIPAFMGTATAINMQKSGERIATTGDFVLLADEVNPVAKTLIEHGIAVTAIHNHMLNESPRLFMLHFWSVGTPENIARGLRMALDNISSSKK